MFHLLNIQVIVTGYRLILRMDPCYFRRHTFVVWTNFLILLRFEILNFIIKKIYFWHTYDFFSLAPTELLLFYGHRAIFQWTMQQTSDE